MKTQNRAEVRVRRPHQTNRRRYDPKHKAMSANQKPGKRLLWVPVPVHWGRGEKFQSTANRDVLINITFDDPIRTPCSSTCPPLHKTIIKKITPQACDLLSDEDFDPVAVTSVQRCIKSSRLSGNTLTGPAPLPDPWPRWVPLCPLRARQRAPTLDEAVLVQGLFYSPLRLSALVELLFRCWFIAEMKRTHRTGQETLHCCSEHEEGRYRSGSSVRLNANISRLTHRCSAGRMNRLQQLYKHFSYEQTNKHMEDDFIKDIHQHIRHN